MSAFISKKCAFKAKHIDLLIEALEAQFGKGRVEVHDKPVNLYGYRGDVRSQKAHIVVRRHHVGPSANDVGYEINDDGSITEHVSEYDRGSTFTEPKRNVVARQYAEGVVGRAAKSKKWKTVSREEQGGKIVMRMRRKKW
jgi:hypothetical protein